MAASQAQERVHWGQAPRAKLVLWAHSRWVALGARMKGLCGGSGPRVGPRPGLHKSPAGRKQS